MTLSPEVRRSNTNMTRHPTNLCSKIVFFYVTIYTSLRYTSAAAAAAGTPTQMPPKRMAGDSTDLDSRDWKDVSDIPHKDCGKKWTCRDFNYASGRGHYVDYSCACDDLCVLLGDCCPDAFLGSSPPASSSGSISGGSDAGGVKVGAALDESSGMRRMPRVRSEKGNSGPQSGVAYNVDSEFVSSRGGDDSSQNPADVSVLGNKPNNNRTVLQDTSKYSRYNLTVDMFSCVYDRSINIANNVSVVSRCPERYADVGVMELCHNVSEDDMMTHLPVSGTVTRVLYRNMFCALCHQVSDMFFSLCHQVSHMFCSLCHQVSHMFCALCHQVSDMFCAIRHQVSDMSCVISHLVTNMLCALCHQVSYMFCVICH